MKVCLVEVNWALLFWTGLLLMNLISIIVQTVLDSKTRKEIVQQNELIREQNKQLNTVIIRVCSKSVRDRKAEQTDEKEKMKDTETK